MSQSVSGRLNRQDRDNSADVSDLGPSFFFLQPQPPHTLGHLPFGKLWVNENMSAGVNLPGYCGHQQIREDPGASVRSDSRYYVF
jgi:hypothetical protein